MIAQRRLLFCIVLFLISITSNAQQRLKTLTEGEFRLITQIFEYDRNTPNNAMILGNEESDIYKKEYIILAGHDNQQVPAYVGIPKTGKAPFPCVLLIPGVGGKKEIFWDDSEYARKYSDRLIAIELLKRGVAIITPDVQYQGQRTIGNNFKDTGTSLFSDLEVYKYQDVVFQTVKDFRKCIDYVSSREDIDSNRIGVAGFSGGGIMTYILAAVDHRFKACAPIVTPVNPFFDPSNSPEWVRFKMPELISPWYYVNGLKDISYLSIDGDADPYSSKEEKMLLIDLVPSRDKTYRFFNSGHQIHPDYASFAADWFLKKL